MNRNMIKQNINDTIHYFIFQNLETGDYIIKLLKIDVNMNKKLFIVFF